MRKYNEEQIKFIRDNVKNKEKDLTDLFNKHFSLNVSVCAMRSLKQRYGFKSGLPTRTKKYTDEQLMFIKENVVNPEKVLMEMFNQKFNLNVSLSTIGNLKRKLNITSGLIGGRFQKGNISHNKGKKWDEFMSKEGQARSRKTCFKKGNIPKNHRPTGSERINVDGYIEIKIAEPNKWTLKHRKIWEEANGKIPAGFNIVFLDQNRLNCNLDNLAMVENAQLAVMNKKRFFTSNAQITQVGISLSKLISATSQKEKNRE